jgi:hypothetical protein
MQIGTAGIRTLQSTLVNFTWGGGKHWVDVATLCAPVHQGSLGLVDVADKASAFRVSGEEDPRKALATFHLQTRNTRYSFNASLKGSWEMR